VSLSGLSRHLNVHGRVSDNRFERSRGDSEQGIRKLVSTALVVLVPEAEPVVADVRARHDPSVRLGVPAHVTLLFLFMPPEAVSASVRCSLRSLFAEFESFSVWPKCIVGRKWHTLTPQPIAPFLALTRGIQAS
jgi:hypothetical protein